MIEDKGTYNRSLILPSLKNLHHNIVLIRSPEFALQQALASAVEQALGSVSILSHVLALSFTSSAENTIQIQGTYL